MFRIVSRACNKHVCASSDADIDNNRFAFTRRSYDI
jgi:hypothetical protein